MVVCPLMLIKCAVTQCCVKVLSRLSFSIVCMENVCSCNKLGSPRWSEHLHAFSFPGFVPELFSWSWPSLLCSVSITLLQDAVCCSVQVCFYLIVQCFGTVLNVCVNFKIVCECFKVAHICLWSIYYTTVTSIPTSDAGDVDHLRVMNAENPPSGNSCSF